MAYTLTYSGNQNPPNPNGSANTTLFVPDGSFAGIGNVTLPGRNFNGYGSPVDQSLLSMLENFASTTTGPANAITGQLWYDVSATTLKYNTSISNVSNWASIPQMDANGNMILGNVILAGNLTVNAPGVITGNGANLTSLNASNLSTGIVANARLSGNYNININGNVVGNVTGNVAGNLTGNAVTANFFNGGNITGNGANLTSLNASNITTGTLAAARLSGTYDINITGSSSGNVTGNVTGDVTGNLTGNSVTANYFTGGNFSGNGSELTSLNAANITSGILDPARLSGTYNISITGGVTTAVTVSGNAQPNIRSVGTLTSLAVSGGVNAGSLAATGNISAGNLTTAGRLSAGSVNTAVITSGSIITAGTITGDWTLTAGSTLSATYADLAERHHTDKPYPVGTVMTVGGENEVTSASVGTKVLGVVSNAYAYLMNSTVGDDTTHPPVAYVGRVPVRVTGPINRHDVIVATLDGCARAGVATEGFGWALESNTDEGEKLVLCIIK